jgi:predicted naringenin-chalcone synthase
LPKDAADDRGPSTAQRLHFCSTAGPLAVQACRRALEQSKPGAANVTHLVTVSCTGFKAPGG